MKERNSFKKIKEGFEYTGDLKCCIELAEQKAKRLQNETSYITRLYTEIKRRYDSHFTAIANAKSFAEIGKKKLAEQQQEQAETTEET